MIVLGSVAALAFASVSMEQSASVQLQGEHLHLPELSILAGASRGSGPDLSLPSSQLVGWLASSPDVRGDHDQGSSSEDKTEEQHKNEAERPGTAPKSESLDFDLLGAPAKAHEVDEHALRLRRTMLNWHQSVGLGMFALQLATTVVGQLNYDDKFGGANTGKYVQPHAVLAYSRPWCASRLPAFAPAMAIATSTCSRRSRPGSFPSSSSRGPRGSGQSARYLRPRCRWPPRSSSTA